MTLLDSQGQNRLRLLCASKYSFVLVTFKDLVEQVKQFQHNIA